MNTVPAPRPRVLALFSEVQANGGIQRFNRTLLAAFAELGVDCDVLSLHGAGAAGCAGNRVRFALAAAARLATRRYDWLLVGHVNFLATAVVLRGLAGLKPPRVMLAAHGIEVWSGIHAGRRWALGRTDRILCVSRYTRDRLLEQAPRLDPGRLMRFPNALAETWRGVTAAAPRESLPPRFVLSVTRLARGDRYKGLVSVIEALGMVDDAELHYVIVGSGEDRAFLERVARRCGVASRVHFRPGAADAELAGMYRQCHAFVLPSGNEGFGIVYLEAMYFGAPVIAAAAKGALDVVTDGETGLLAAFADTVAIAAAIDRLAADPALRARLCAAGRAAVSADGEFTFRRFVARSARALGIATADATEPDATER